MSTPVIQPAFTVGEVAPSLFGRVDVARLHTAAATMRNLWPSYKGGAYSRAGTAFVGFSKQTGRSFPPRLIPFQFSINQGLAIEFGHQYMRVIQDGAYVTESAVPITGITRANPGVVSASATGVLSATANNGGVVSSYAPGDTITLAGGTFVSPAVLAVASTLLISVQVKSPGNGVYAPGDTITLAGGTESLAPVVTVSHTQVASASIVNGGTAGADGTATVTGTTGTGTKFQALVTISGGAITAINSITSGGDYTINPTDPANEPVTGGGLSGAVLNVSMGVLQLSVTTAGVLTANPSDGEFTQASTSGSGTDAAFQFSVFGINSLTVSSGGVYTALPSNPVSQASTSGSGKGAIFNISSGGVSAFNNGDWVYLSDINGMTQLNGRTCVVAGATTTSFQLKDVYGNNVDTTSFSAYTSGGTASRIFTLTTPYDEQDLEWIKWTQSADVMSICCVNQSTGTEYAPQDLSRLANDNWSFSSVESHTTVSAPGSVSGAASSSGNLTYQYVVTSISPDDGTESVSSPTATIASAVDIASTAGTITLTWTSVAGVNQYNVYKATPGLNNTPPVGALFGYAGSAYGTQFIDQNIVADFSQVPPRHKNPFSRGKILGATVVQGGSGYSSAQAVISTSTGSGANLQAVIINGQVVAWIVLDEGKNYAATDTISVAGDGSGATATLTFGPETGTYPSVPSYFQQRRVFANSLNNPDTYWMSQPGAYNNFDSRIPTIDSDSITGTPWSVQVNGIQFLINMPGGLVVLTGLSAWQIIGAGSYSTSVQAITPSNQQAQPQAYNGCSPTVPPIRIDYDIVYVQSKGSIYRDLAYQFFTNIYTGSDLTINSSHLFTGYTIREHAWCEEPYKILWSVRNDGILLSLTYLKPEQVQGWARHDTNGLFKSVCSITEPPVDALYLAVQRRIGAHTAYTVERMDDRIWTSVEDCWCVDCGFELAQPAPNATLSASSAAGLGAISGITELVGGEGYSAATTVTVVDDNGLGSGSGAVLTPTVVGGVITAITVSNAGSGYVYPQIVINDPTNAGAGASATAVLDNTMTFTADASVFVPGDVGKVVRMGGGIATITAYVSGTEVTANITVPITAIQPNDDGSVQAQPSGTWTMTAPVTTVTGLLPLAGATVTGLADGNVVTPRTVAADGTVTLDSPASAVILGLGFQAQLQSVYLDVGESPTVQGQRKKVGEVTARIQSSRGFKVGANQLDGSTVTPMQIAPAWNNMKPIQDKSVAPYNSSTEPLFTGDTRLPVVGGFNTPGQVALQQDSPLPMEVLALIPDVWFGDVPEQKWQPPQRGR
jgi:hypothetical protein